MSKRTIWGSQKLKINEIGMVSQHAFKKRWEHVLFLMRNVPHLLRNYLVRNLVLELNITQETFGTKDKMPKKLFTCIIGNFSFLRIHSNGKLRVHKILRSKMLSHSQILI